MINGELIDRRFSKGEGIRAICRYLERPLSDTIGFGDSDNDLAMADGGHQRSDGQRLREPEAALPAHLPRCDRGRHRPALQSWVWAENKSFSS